MKNDTLNALEERLQRYYAQQQLPLDVLVDLESTIEETEIKLDPSWYWISVRMVPIAKVAAMAIALLALVGLSAFWINHRAENKVVENVAAEIALNHSKQFNSEFFSANIPSLSHSMELLDFAPVHPRRMQLEKYDINGARYCTIGSSIAVQVRLADAQQRDYTLYEFRAPESLQIDDERIIEVGDIEVTLWQEGNVTMGLARRMHQF